MADSTEAFQAPPTTLTEEQWKAAFTEVFQQNVLLQRQLSELTIDHRALLDERREMTAKMRQVETAVAIYDSQIQRLSADVHEMNQEQEIFTLVKAELYQGLQDVVDAADAQVQGDYIAVPRRITDRLRRLLGDVDTLRNNARNTNHESEE